MKSHITCLFLWLSLVTISLPIYSAGRTKHHPARNVHSNEKSANQGVVSEDALEKNLDKVISVEIIDTELRHAVDTLARELEISIVIDPRGLEEAGVTLQQKTTLVVRHVRLRSALDLLLKPLHLTTIHKNDVLMITSEERAAEELITKVYDCTDLLTFIDPETDWHANFGFGFGSTGLPPTKEQVAAAELQYYRENLDAAVRKIQKLKAQLKQAKESRTAEKILVPDFDSLIELVTSQIVPDGWLDNGGNSTISGYMLKDKGFLVISQTEETHQQIELLFSQMRSKIKTTAEK